MSRARLAPFVVLLVALSARPAWAGQPATTFSAPDFGQVSVYAPSATPTTVVLFISGDGGWNLGVVSMAETLRNAGALVVGIDIRSLMATLDRSDRCAYPAGMLEQLSRDVQLRWKLPHYIRPLVVGYSSGATLAYASLAAAPAETFAGAISLGFCPDMEIQRPLCQQHGLAATPRRRGIGYDLQPDTGLSVPWIVLQGEVDLVCAADTTRTFVNGIPTARLVPLPKVGHGFGVTKNWEPQFLDAFRTLVEREPARSAAPAAATPGVEDLALTEVLSDQAPGERRDTMAILLTGDGGWADIDKGVSTGLAAQGIPTVGWSSLTYYWMPRTPDGAALDLARIIRHYTSAWHRHRVILVGYSFGADVLPFLVNRLPADAASAIESVALLGPSSNAAFEFHVSSWLGGGGEPAYSTGPEIERLRVPAVCVRGMSEEGSPCSSVANAQVSSVVVGQGHHFGGDHARLVAAILARH